MKNLILNLIVTLCLCSACQGHSKSTAPADEILISNTEAVAKQAKDPIVEKITIKTADGLEMTADKYTNADKNAKWIILCHQARFSRGEYIETALKFVNMGYSCLALDQRSGDAVNGVMNETHERASKTGLGTEYADALPDLEAALDYTKNVLAAKDIMLIGSSYSSSLAVIMAAKYPNDIDAIACFSPGNYFKIDGQSVADFAKKVTVPTFIASSADEADSWKEIYANIPSEDKTSFLPESQGFHGSKALWKKSEGHGNYWSALTSFLEKHF